MKIKFRFTISIIAFLLSINCFAADIKLTTTNPLPPQYGVGSQDGKVVDVSSLSNADTSYFYFNLTNDGYNAFSMQHIITANTLTYEGTMDKANVSDGSANWVDITSMLTDGSTSSFTSSGSLTISLPMAWNRIRMKRVTTNASNSLKLILTRIKI